MEVKLNNLICREAAKGQVELSIKSLVGEILTLLDGVIQEETARKASKDMAKKMIWEFGRKVRSGIDRVEGETEDKGKYGIWVDTSTDSTSASDTITILEVK